MWLSILIPVYNVQSYVIECLESVVSQSNENIEVIILDDASTDGSFDTVGRFISDTKSNVRLIKHESNKGLSAARNTLLSHAAGDYVWFLDSDDALCAGAIASLERVVKNYSPDLIMCDYCIWRPTLINTVEKGVHVKSFSGENNVLSSVSWDVFTGLYRAGQLHSWTKISKRTLWQDDIKFQEGIYFEDMVHTPRLALKAKNYFYAKEVWVNYRQHGASIMATPNLKKINDMLNGLANVLSIWEREFLSAPNSAKKAYYRFCLKTFRFALRCIKSSNVCHTKQVESQLRQAFFAAIDKSKWQLCQFFLMNGDFKRFVRTLKI